ncbi:MAG: hypothetical protein U0T75_08740 [Chitinophagales bacterium]
MTYKLIIEKGKEESVISLLKRFSYVKVVQTNKAKPKVKRKAKMEQDPQLPYFGTFPNWPLDHKKQRSSDIQRRLKGWL